jgi:hypothetical protein
MSRKDWSEYDRETRKYIKKRDNNQCIITGCGSKNNLQIMHIWVNRSHGGKGCKENGVLGCMHHHQIIDNPIGKEQNELSKKLLQECKEYLIEKENINPDETFIQSLKFKKEIVQVNTNLDYIKGIKQKDRCKHCKYLIKNKYNKSSIPSYYCKYRHILIHKTTEACKNFKNC